MSNNFVDDVMDYGQNKTKSVASKNVIDFGLVEFGERYSKAQILALRPYQRYYNILSNVLDSEKTYTLCEASRLIIDYMQKKGIR